MTPGRVVGGIFGLILLVVAWNQQSTLAELRDFVTNACAERTANIIRSNERSRAFIEIERDNPYQHEGPDEQAVIDRRIAVWEASILPLPDCSR